MYTTKTSMLQKLADNDNIGWQEFYDIYFKLIHSIALKSGVPSADADDISQAVMLGVFNNGEFRYSKDKHGLFRTWLGGIIRHKISDYFKRNCPRTENLPEPELVNLSFEKIFLDEYRQHILDLAIAELHRRVTPEVFETFELCCIRNLPDKEVASILDEKPNTVTIRKKRCLECLRSIIKQFNNADPGLELPLS